MAELPRQVIDDYIAKLNLTISSARQLVERALVGVSFESEEQLRKYITTVMRYASLGGKKLASMYTVDFYNEVREFALGSVYSASSAATIKNFDLTATDRAVNAFITIYLSDGKADKLINNLLNRVAYDTKIATEDTIFRLGNLDPSGSRWARVPTGSETCPWCIMLGSLGYFYYTEKTASLSGHVHANCDCVLVPQFGGMTVQGYDPGKLYDDWRAIVKQRAKDMSEKKGIPYEVALKQVENSFRSKKERPKTK